MNKLKNNKRLTATSTAQVQATMLANFNFISQELKQRGFTGITEVSGGMKALDGFTLFVRIDLKIDIGFCALDFWKDKASYYPIYMSFDITNNNFRKPFKWFLKSLENPC